MQQRRVSDEGLWVVKLCPWGRIMTVPLEEAPANSVPAAAVIRRGQALSGIIGRKGYVGGSLSAGFKAMAQPLFALRTGGLECRRGKRNS